MDSGIQPPFLFESSYVRILRASSKNSWNFLLLGKMYPVRRFIEAKYIGQVKKEKNVVQEREIRVWPALDSLINIQISAVALYLLRRWTCQTKRTGGGD